MASCNHCGASAAGNARYCGDCGSLLGADFEFQMSDARQIEGTSCAPSPPSSERTALSRRWVVAVAAIIVGALVFVAVSESSSSTPHVADESRETRGLPGSETLPLPDAVPAPPIGGGSFPSASPPQIGSAGGVYGLAVRQDDSIVVVDLETARRVEVELAEPAVRDGLASAGRHIAYLGKTNAFLVAIDGSTVLDLGTADVVIDSAQPTSVWIGEQTEASRVSWREIDQDGNVQRSTITAAILDFDRPDLRSGHQQRMLRLTTDESRPWKVFAHGAPIAVGLNDLILATCDADLNCGRRWFELETGLDRGPLLADIADRVTAPSVALLSATGRYIATEDNVSSRTVVVSLATGREVATECREPDTLQWSPDDDLLACAAERGVVVQEVDTGARFTIDTFDDREPSFTFVSD